MAWTIHIVPSGPFGPIQADGLLSNTKQEVVCFQREDCKIFSEVFLKDRWGDQAKANTQICSIYFLFWKKKINKDFEVKILVINPEYISFFPVNMILRVIELRKQ